MSLQVLPKRDYTTSSESPPSIQSNEKPKTEVTLTQLMGKTFLAPNLQGISLHDQVRGLDFYSRLTGKVVTADELLQHFVNNYAIFNAIESLNIKNNPSLKVLEGIGRTNKLMQDIQFFERKFHIAKPSITPETQKFVDFIHLNVKEDPNFLLPIMYTLYGGLFVGRFVCNATAAWLKDHVEMWEILPPDQRGLSYWNFEGLNTPEDLSNRKERLLAEINKLGEPLNRAEKFQEITREAFTHNYLCIKSVVPKPLKKQPTINPDEAKTRNVLKIALASIFILALFTKCHQMWYAPQAST